MKHHVHHISRVKGPHVAPGCGTGQHRFHRELHSTVPSREPGGKQELQRSLQADSQSWLRGPGAAPEGLGMTTLPVPGLKEAAQFRLDASESRQPRASVWAKLTTFRSLHLAAKKEVGAGQSGLTPPCWVALLTEALELCLHSLGRFPNSPSLELGEEHQDMRFQNNTEV